MGIPVDNGYVVGFTAVIEVGAIAAVLAYFFGDIVRFGAAWCRGIFHPDARRSRDYKFAWWVIFATAPVVVAGLVFESP
jgi:undecaprenyl-diphosphatase